jgi:hypothetical protein
VKAFSLLRFFVAKDQEMTCRHAQWLIVIKKLANLGKAPARKAATRNRPRPLPPKPVQPGIARDRERQKLALTRTATQNLEQPRIHLVRTAAKIEQHSPLREHSRPTAPHNPLHATQNRLTNTVYRILYIREAALIRSTMRGHPNYRSYRSGKKQPIMFRAGANRTESATQKPGAARRARPKRIKSTTI